MPVAYSECFYSASPTAQPHAPSYLITITGLWLAVVWHFVHFLDGCDIYLVESSLFKMSNNNKKVKGTRLCTEKDKSQSRL